jgi:hypothetical protein
MGYSHFSFYPTGGKIMKEQEKLMGAAPKFTDEKGRLLLGTEYANQQFLIEKQTNGSIILKPSITVPVDEAWLYRNPTALNMVLRGLDQAKQKRFVENPSYDEKKSWKDELED